MSQDDLVELIEDWLDNAHHRGKLPKSMSFEDIMKVARILSPLVLSRFQEPPSEVCEICGSDEDGHYNNNAECDKP